MRNSTDKTDASARQSNPAGLPEFLAILRERRDLDAGESAQLFDLIRKERNTEAIAGILREWSRKGFTSAEIAQCAGMLRRDAVKVRCEHDDFIDLVGTGGSKAKTFNVSTAAAFVVSGAGLPVAKHGNRAATSKTGSADALGHLGVNLVAEPGKAEECLNKAGMCFMFAPRFHALSAELADARRSIGKPTLFNLIGPLANPAGAPYQLIGIWDSGKASVYAEAVLSLGTKCTWIVNGSDGLDELTVAGPTSVWEVSADGIRDFEFSPEDFGIRTRRFSGLMDLSPKQSGEVVLGVIDGSDAGVARDLVLLNAAAALLLTGTADDPLSAAEMAAGSIDSGRALEKLGLLIEITNR